MERVWSVELPNHVGEKVVIAGWLQRLRRLSKVSFVVLRDGRGLVQAVLDHPTLVEQVASLQSESVMRIEGEVMLTPQAPRGVELRGEKIDILSEATEPPPFELHRPEIAAQLPTFLDHAGVGLRHPRHRALFRLAAASVAGFRRALVAEHFVEIFTPKLVATATEGGANVFAVDYFGRPAYWPRVRSSTSRRWLASSSACSKSAQSFAPNRRHLNQYASLDAEMGFVEDHTTVMALLERTIAGMLSFLQQTAQEELELLGCELPAVPAHMPVIDFIEAQRLIHAATGEDVLGEPDLAPSHERWLGEWAAREHGSEFLFVTGYPLVKRPFYTHPDPSRPGQTNSFDLLFRGLELVTGGQRLHTYADYLAALAERGQDPAPFAGYLEAFKHGMPPHGGFAMGLERWVARLVGAANVRETTLFPRDMQRLTP